MDKVWDSLALDNQADLAADQISAFYSHPIWIVNGIFSAVDPDSIAHRKSIAEYVDRLGANQIMDYGGGFGELALKLCAVRPELVVDIIEPYPSDIARTRMETQRRIRYISKIAEAYDCSIAQDVLEHLEDPVQLLKKLTSATRMGGYLIFANCFYPVIKCHLPASFYLRHTLKWVVKSLGLAYRGRVPGADHALVFQRIGPPNDTMLTYRCLTAKAVGPLLNAIAALYFRIFSHRKAS